jgi:adenylosuccinate lyase
LQSISTLDGLHFADLENVSEYVSEYTLIKNRVFVQIAWVKHLARKGMLEHPNGDKLQLTEEDFYRLNAWFDTFELKDAEWIKNRESELHHEIASVRSWLTKHCPVHSLDKFFNFGCTSDDTDNLSFSLMSKAAMSEVILPVLRELKACLTGLSIKYADTAMLSRTHGQAASPTTLGKELANFTYRVHWQMKNLEAIRYTGKINGSVGNYNALVLMSPEHNWINTSKEFVESLGLDWCPFTTQIEPHDNTASMCNALSQLNTVLVGVCRDMWRYVGLGYFRGDTGDERTSAYSMPNKVNPVHFENAEGKLEYANAQLIHLFTKLPISRFQRDLSDTIAMRNLGASLASCYIGYTKLILGFNTVQANHKMLKDDLDGHWEILAEPVQMILRRCNYERPYELLKSLTRGKQRMTREDYQLMVKQLIELLNLKPSEAKELRDLTPFNYIGLADKLARNIARY